MAHWISPQYTNEHFGGNPTLEQKILIFEDRILGWQLEIAEELRKQIEDEANTGKPIQHAAFALISILFSYFEMLAQYMKGEKSTDGSRSFFKDGIEHVFPGEFTDTQKNEIYRRIRCGMYHSGLVQNGALIDGNYRKPIQINKHGHVLVNPHKLSRRLKQHFKDYIKKLKDPTATQERENFEKMFNRAKKV